MKLLFVENRYATWLYDAIARRLEDDGHEIHWIVQNPVFSATTGTTHRVSFPSSDVDASISSKEKLLFARIAASDRQVLYFGKNAAHYGHYFLSIQSVIDVVRPGIVFGECTQFYELLTIEICRRRDIQYLNAVTIGCPAGRFYFLGFDTKDPIGGDQSSLTKDEAISVLGKINGRSSLPVYMTGVRLILWEYFYTRLRDWCRITFGWVLGERFATPSPISKVRLELRQRMIRRRWERISKGYSSAQNGFVLYALHVQPECSIDVWGCAWRDQTELIRRAANALSHKGIILAVKPHPNSKYEINSDLCDVVSRSTNILAIPASVPMSRVFSNATAILGVTGTVLLEAVFAGKPAISVGPNAMSKYPGIIEIERPEDVVSGIERASNRAQSPQEVAVDLLRWLYRQSYGGEMFEPLFSQYRLGKNYMEELYRAFRSVISVVEECRWHSPR